MDLDSIVDAFVSDGSQNAVKADSATPTVLIPHLADHPFSFGGTVSPPDGPVVAISDDDSVFNLNEFKRNPGVAGMLYESDGVTPASAGITVTLRDETGMLVGQTETDIDGFYFIAYKHKGRRSSYTVDVLGPGPSILASDTITLKGNGFAEASFNLP